MTRTWKRIPRRGLLVLGIAIAASLAMAAAAQSGGPGRSPDPDARLAHLTERLALGPEQQGAIRPLLVEQSQQIQALRAQARSGELDRDALRSRAQAIRAETDRKIEATLTREQRESYRQLVQERAQTRRGEPGRRGGSGPGAGRGTR